MNSIYYPIFLLLSLALAINSCTTKKEDQMDFRCTSYVNPFIGTSNSDVAPVNLSENFTAGNTYPGAVLPWGMVSASPHNIYTPGHGNGYLNIPSGYFYGEKYIFGFGHLHLSGVGCRDLGNFLTTPTSGTITNNLDKIKSTYSNEEASPGYYKVQLNDSKVIAELSATTRTTLSKFTFQKASDSANILIDLFHNLIPADSAQVNITAADEIEGWNYNHGFCGYKKGRKVYFVAKFNKQSIEQGTWDPIGIRTGKLSGVGSDIGAFMQFKVEENESILMKLGISYVSVENARLNLETEQPGWDFNKVRVDANSAWEKELSKIKVKGGTDQQKTVFYTALYHSLLHPNIFEDVNGEYISMKKHQVRTISAEQKHQYTVFSLWDTYRNLHQLLTLFYPEQQTDMLRTMVDIYMEGGFLPKWEITSQETNVMVGDPGCMVIADSYLKGLAGFNIDSAYVAMLKSGNTIPNPIRPGLNQYIKCGFIPEDDKGYGWVWGSVATTLEYCIADFCISQIADALGKTSDAELFRNRAAGYKNYYDEETGFMRPKNKDGSWYSPFDPDTIRGSIPGASFPNGGVGFVEGNAWQYTFFVPHDIPGLIELMGKRRFLAQLQAAFDKPGRFELFNEPDMAYPFLFNYTPGEEWRTQKLVRDLIDKYFSASPGGLPGNDDCGTMSAWIVFSMMGLYPDCPGKPEYQLCSPVFDVVTFQLQAPYYSGRQFTIKSSENAAENFYIKSKELNNTSHSTFTISHADIVNGGELSIELNNHY